MGTKTCSVVYKTITNKYNFECFILLTTDATMKLNFDTKCERGLQDKKLNFRNGFVKIVTINAP